MNLRFACAILLCWSMGCDDASRSAGNRGGNHPPPSDDGGGFPPSSDDGGGPGVVRDPTTCDEALQTKSYIGCDYWPTVVYNAVWSIFDFAVVVSNPGDMEAMVTVTGPNNTNQTVTVPPNQLVPIYLPWVAALKGPDASAIGAPSAITASVFQAKGAYHLVSTLPVLVYQFNALEYKGAGGPPGKNWSSCPGITGCFSYSNDASLLLPSTAMTGNYRVVSEHGVDDAFLQPGTPGFFAITATQDNTNVKVKLSKNGQVLAGTGVSAISGGATSSFTMNAGDVVELTSNHADATDLTGSLVQADKPVQIIGGSPCMNNPEGHDACDHIEESTLPAETLGKHYIVTVPTGPNGTPVGHTVRLIGNVDGTKLTFDPAISGAPSTLDAGQVVELGLVTKDFVVTGDHEFIVSTIMLSGQDVDPSNFGMAKGDPSLSVSVAVEQYRLKYLFLAPQDYDVNYADIVVPTNAQVMLDGAAVTTAPTAIGTGGYGVLRVKLSSGKAGAHTLTSDQPIGLQVSGYGLYTSYQYPGGLNLLLIAPPPIL